MKLYSILHNPNLKNEDEAWVLYDLGFSYVAAILQTFWAFFHNLWLVTFSSLAFIMALHHLEASGIISSQYCLLMRILIAIYIGFSANDWHVAKLEKSGFVLKDVIAADNKEKALLKFHKKMYKASQTTGEI